MREVYIVSACRTAVGSYGGSLKDIPAVRLGAAVISEALKRGNVKPEQVQEVLMGNVLQAGLGQNPARQASIYAGLPVETPSMTINKVCGSGLRAVSLAAQIILLGDAECIVAGGMESMSQAPYVLKSHRWGARMGNNEILDVMVHDGLTDVYNQYHMGVTAENVTEEYVISRQEQDEFAYKSQMKAVKAIKDGKFKDEILPFEIPQRKGNPVIFDTDEYPKEDTTIEKLARLKPAFKSDGAVTAGNSSGINDGAAVVVVASKEFVLKNGLKPIAKIVSYASKGVDPRIMGLGPVNSTRKALSEAGLKVEDIGLYEANEAFAAQALAVSKELGLPQDRVNVNGGAIALGHPIGASGARILVSLLYEMKKRKEKYGLATLCIGGGMGTAVIVQRDEICE